jgi:predicted nucleic acid-binding protein
LILLDTSVLVNFLSGRSTRATLLLERLVTEQAEFYLTGPVIQEVLQGARDPAEWRRLEVYLSSQLRVQARDPLRSYVEAARIYFECRRKGLTVRSTADCLVAQIALENKLALLQDDRDFEAIAQVRPLRMLP